MQVHCNEGVAIHIGPEPCAGIREEAGEASVGERIGQPLSPVSGIVPGADAVFEVEGETDRRVRAVASAWPTRRGPRTWHVRTLFAREPGDLGSGPPRRGRVRIGKARSRSR